MTIIKKNVSAKPSSLHAIFWNTIKVTAITGAFIASNGYAMNASNQNTTGDDAGFKTVKENIKVAPWFKVYRPADLNAAVQETGKALPLVVWTNGGCLRADFPWQTLFKRWAAEGYVVLALSADPENGSLGMTSAVEHGELIDWALSNPDYTDIVDPDGVIAAGNSCGGVTALNLTAKDPRVAGVFVLSGSSALGMANKKVMQSIKVPVGYVIGGEEDISGGPARKDFDALDDDIPAMLINRKEGGHLVVSTDKETLKEVADISFHWMDLILNGSQTSYDELTAPDVCSDCAPGNWTLKPQNLDALIK